MKKSKITAMMVLIALMLSIVSTGAMAKNSGSDVNIQINQDGSVQVAMKFKDLQQASWAMKNILKMNAENIIAGYNDGSFRPNKPVTHAEAVVLTMKAAGLQSEIDSKTIDKVYLPYKDAKSIPVWAKKAIAVAVEKGYLQPGPSGNFQPNKEASRQWVVRLIAKALNLQPVDIQLPFTDASKISADNVGYVAAVVYNQLISGFPDGSFQPNKPVSRAEIAVMLGISTNELPIPGQMKFKVEGTIDSVSVQATTVTDQMYGGVADQVYGGVAGQVYGSQGSITLKLEKDDDDDEDEDEDEDEDQGNQTTVTYPVSTNALIYINDQAAKLSDLVVGSKAEAVVKNGMIAYLEVEPVVVKGVVQAVYNDTVTVIDNKWEHGRKNASLTPAGTTYNLASDVAVTINGVSAKVTDLKAGDVVRMTMNAEQKINSIKAVWFVKRNEEKEREREKEKVKEIAKEKDKENNEKAKQNEEKKQQQEKNKNQKKQQDQERWDD